MSEAKRVVCEEIQKIMAVYREQDASPEGLGTPGGLEHMGDVWRLLNRWDGMLTKPKDPKCPTPPAPSGEEGRDKVEEEVGDE